MAPHSSTLAWKTPWTEEPGRLQSMGSLRVRHDWATSLSLFTFMHWRRNGNPLQCSCLENTRDGGAWWAAVSGVAQSRTRLKRLSSSSSIDWLYICLLDEYEFSFPCGFTLHLPDHSLDRASFRMFIDHLCFLLGKCLFVLWFSSWIVYAFFFKVFRNFFSPLKNTHVKMLVW